MNYPAENLQYRLAFHCAPVLAGLKPANLISLRKGSEGAARELARCRRRLGDREVRLFLLRESARHLLVLVYREGMLAAQLGRRSHRAFLRGYGYDPERQSVPEMLTHLAHRLREAGEEYPHEVGVFLGYPLDDIRGFIRHGGAACKLSGYWKVYADEGRARTLFAAYDAARSFYCQRVLRGDEIHTIQYEYGGM